MGLLDYWPDEEKRKSLLDTGAGYAGLLGQHLLDILSDPAGKMKEAVTKWTSENLPAHGDSLEAVQQKMFNLATQGMGGVGTVGRAAVAPKLAPMPQMATRYPEAGLPALQVDKTSGKLFAGKGYGPEELQVKALREQAQREIEAGTYSPLFDVSKREMVDPSNYPIKGSTVEDAIPKTWPTFDKYYEQYNTPDVKQRLLGAFDRGVTDPEAHKWYAMRQLEDAFVAELGPKAGRDAFRKSFSEGMASTTAGTDPAANLINTAYGNFLRVTGKDYPRGRDMSINSFDAPHPAGGRYFATGAKQYDRAINQGAGFVAEEQPKMFNFSGNFMGHASGSTIDEQMMRLFDPSGKIKAPEPGSYGALEQIIREMAQARGVSPMEFQAIAWSGAKGQAKPMMNHINEMIHRTSTVTGKTPQEVLRGFIRSDMPMYGMGGAAIGTGLLAPQQGGRAWWEQPEGVQ